MQLLHKSLTHSLTRFLQPFSVSFLPLELLMKLVPPAPLMTVFKICKNREAKVIFTILVLFAVTFVHSTHGSITASRSNNASATNQITMPFSVPIAQASADTTTKGGEVIIKNDDGTMYVSRELSTQSGHTSNATQRSVRSGTSILGNGVLSIPTGFSTDFFSLMQSILSIVMVVSIALVLMYLILGAFQWITSGGDRGKIEQARNKITAAIIGIIIVASSYAILLVTLQFLGFESLEDVFNSTRSLNGQQNFTINVVPQDATPQPSPTIESET